MAAGDIKLKTLRTYADKLKAKRQLCDEQIETLGPDHKDTLATENDIALLLFGACQYDKALTIFQKVYTKRSYILGPNHKDTIASQNKMGWIYSQQNRLDEALITYNEIYKKRCDALGSNHNDTQGSLCNIGLVQQKQGEYDKAFETYNELESGLVFQYKMARALRKGQHPEKALEFFYKIHEKVFNRFGPHHTETLTSKFRIGKALAKTKKSEEALKIYEEVLRRRMKLLGPLHKHTISALRHAGVARYEVGNVDEGFDNLHEAHSRAKDILGPGHRKTLKIQADIGDLLCSEGKYNEALEVYKEIYRIQTSKNPENLDAYQTKVIIGDICCKKGQYIKAYENYSEARKHIAVWDYNERASLKNKMVYSLVQQKVPTERLDICKKWIDDAEKTFGPEEPRALVAHEDYAEALVALNNYDHALTILKNVFAQRLEILGIDHIDTLRTRQYMADVLAKLHKYTDAADAYKEICTIRKDLPFTMYTYYALTNLAAMYCLLGKHKVSLETYKERFKMKVKCEGQASITGLEQNIVYTLVKNIRDDKVLKAFQKLCDVALKIQDPENRVAIVIHNTVAKILQAQEKYGDALKAFEKVYELKKKLPSSGLNADFNARKTILKTRNNIANMCKLLGKTTEALEIFTEVYEEIKLALDPEDPICLDAQMTLALAEYLEETTDTAFTHYLQTYRKSKKKLGPESPHHSQCDEALKKFRTGMPKSELVKIIDGKTPHFLPINLHLQANLISCINNQDISGATPLHYASQKGDILTLSTLLKNHAFYNVEDKVGKTPLDYASTDELANLLYQVHTFFIASKHGDEESVAKLIKEDSIFNAIDKDGNTGFHWANKEGHVNIVKIWKEKGLDVSIKNKKGVVAQEIATSAKNKEIVDIFNNFDKTVPGRLSGLINDNGGNTAIHLAARKGHLEILKLLIHHNADPTVGNDHGYTPLHFAAFEDNTIIVEELLQYVKENNHKKLTSFVESTNTADGLTALDIASIKEFTETAGVLKKYGASLHHKDTKTNKKNNDKCTLKF